MKPHNERSPNKGASVLTGTPEHSNPDKGHSKPYLSVRQRQGIKALLQGPVKRKQLDTLTEASNGPAIIHELRDMELEIICDLEPYTSAAGATTKRGVYNLHPNSRILARELLARGGK